MKAGRKGAKKKVADPFSEKDWCGVKAPAMFNIILEKHITRTQENKIASDGLKAHMFEVSLANMHSESLS